MAGFPMAGQSASKIVDPNTVYTEPDKKIKANLNSYQVAMLSQVEALERCMNDPDKNVVQELMDEMRQHSRSLIVSKLSMRGAANEIYREVATTRVAVEDRKRTMQLEQNTI